MARLSHETGGDASKCASVLNSDKTGPEEGLPSSLQRDFHIASEDESRVCERPTQCVRRPTDCDLADYKTIIKKLYILNLSAFPIITQRDHENTFHCVLQSEQHISVD